MTMALIEREKGVLWGHHLLIASGLEYSEGILLGLGEGRINSCLMRGKPWGLPRREIAERGLPSIKYWREPTSRRGTVLPGGGGGRDVSRVAEYTLGKL